MQKIKQNIEFLGLSFKKELRNFIIVNLTLILLSIAIYFLSRQITYSLVMIVLLILFSILYVTRYSSMVDKINAKNIEEFTNLFSYFRIYVRNGLSVYSALQEITHFANSSLSKMLKELLKEIDSDKSVQPFIKFGKNFNEIIIEEMMLSIYQMIDDGVDSDYLVQFELIFDKFSENIYQNSLKKRDSRLATLSSSSLVASCYLMIVLTIGIIGLIGELVNGI